MFDFFNSKKKLLKNSFVEKVNLKYIFPNKICLEIKERKPECYIKYLNDAYILVDNNLRVLEITKSKEKKVPIFTFGICCLYEGADGNVCWREYASHNVEKGKETKLPIYISFYMLILGSY